MTTRRAGGWRARLGSVRVRITFAAVVVVGLALVFGSVALVVALRRSLTSDVRTALELRASDVASALEAGTSPARLSVDDGEDAFIQVLDDEGRVAGASENMTGQPAVTDLTPGASSRVDGLAIDDDDFLVVAEAAAIGNERWTVLVGRTLEVVDESTGFVTGVLLAGVPVLLVIVGATAWMLVGRALSPVEAIRREVDTISGSALHHRVPEPESHDEIHRLAVTMNHMLDRLEATQARQQRFVSDASHELRSPIASIRQHAEVALAHNRATSAEELAQVVLEEDLRLQNLVEDLLDLARADEHRLRITRRPVDLDDLLFEEAGRLRTTTSLDIDTGSVSGGRVSGDAGQLARCVRNLTENAVRHARTTVALALSETDDKATVVLCVDDDGPGIPKEQRERVFERFVRLDEARAREAGGSGLGLSIATVIVEAHGGTITVAESPLGGAHLEVRIPATN